MRYRLLWKPAIVTVAVTTAIGSGLFIAQRSLRLQAAHLVASGYDRASNPDMTTEAEWKAMSWEEKRVCKQRFATDMMLREFRSSQLNMLAMFMQLGIAIAVLTGLCVIAARCSERRSPPNDSPPTEITQCYPAASSSSPGSSA